MIAHPLTLALVAVGMVCAACGETAHTAMHGTATGAPRCPLPVVSGGLPATYLRESTVIGPLAIYPAKSEYPTFRRSDFAPVSGHGVFARFSSLDAAVTVSTIGRVTVSIPANQQDHARLLFDRSRFGNAGYRLSDGSGSYTFVGCKKPYTQYQGGFIVTSPGCVDVEVRIAGKGVVERRRLQFGTRHCASKYGDDRSRGSGSRG